MVVGLGWVDLDFGHSINCPTLVGQLEVWQNGQNGPELPGNMMEHLVFTTICPTLYVVGVILRMFYLSFLR